MNLVRASSLEADLLYFFYELYVLHDGRAVEVGYGDHVVTIVLSTAKHIQQSPPD